MVDEQAQVSYLEYLKFDVDYLIDNGFITKICDASTLEGFIYFVGATYNGLHYEECKKKYLFVKIKNLIKFVVSNIISIMILSKCNGGVKF